jgi:hypothetical protein
LLTSLIEITTGASGSNDLICRAPLASLKVSIAADPPEPFTPARPLAGVRAGEFAGLRLAQRLQ